MPYYIQGEPESVEVRRLRAENKRLNAKLNNQAAAVVRLRAYNEGLAKITRQLDQANAALRAALKPSKVELTELLRSKMCGPHQECDEAHDCTCRDAATAVLELLQQRAAEQNAGQDK